MLSSNSFFTTSVPRSGSWAEALKTEAAELFDLVALKARRGGRTDTDGRTDRRSRLVERIWEGSR